MIKKVTLGMLIPAITLVASYAYASTDSVNSSLEQLRDNATSQTSTLSASAKKQMRQAKDKTGRLKDDANSQASALSASAKKQISQAKDKADDLTDKASKLLGSE